MFGQSCSFRVCTVLFISCDNSYFAHDTTKPCFGENGERDFDMCCKTALPKNRNGPEDFYCFYDKGSIEGNDAYCIQLADNPPVIFALEPGYKKKSQSNAELPPKSTLRSLSPEQHAKGNEAHTNAWRIIVLFLMLITGVISLFMYKEAIKRHLRSDNDQEEQTLNEEGDHYQSLDQSLA